MSVADQLDIAVLSSSFNLFNSASSSSNSSCVLTHIQIHGALSINTSYGLVLVYGFFHTTCLACQQKALHSSQDVQYTYIQSPTLTFSSVHTCSS